MNPEVCQCPGCICELDDSAVRRGDEFFCCQSCAEGHQHHEQVCRDPECPCTDQARKRSAESQLDHSLEETFPASDPISP
ncbi:metallothionein [Pseudomonas sp. LA21]|uniref:metallothionein n=1 Tax=Pseudomonas sp. LA21 TaxID=2893373 RepID=UPI001FB81C09|nr:metallothionein [Pseudomonas sp. LA21]MCJ1886989.1 metallothionein [Pseudomonas sp. LA21]